MSAPIFNRDFTHPADGWYQIEPEGRHLNKPAGVEQVIDQAAKIAIVSRFNSDADAGTLSHGTEMLIDHEHFKHDLTKESRAFGWLTGLQERDDGIYGQIRWTVTGKSAVDGGDYRFFSTEYDPDDLQILDDSGEVKIARPLRLSGLTLTNSPNNKGGRPITNRETEIATELSPAIGHDAETIAAERIANRAHALKTIVPGLSFLNRWNRARKELTSTVSNSQEKLSNRLVNRAQALKDANPSRPFEACWNQARNEIQGS